MIQYFCPPGILRKIDENVALFRQILQEKFRKNWKNTYVIGFITHIHHSTYMTPVVSYKTLQNLNSIYFNPLMKKLKCDIFD